MGELGTILIEVSGGVVQDVSGLPEGWDYEIADYDNCSDCGGVDPLCEDCQEEARNG